MDDSFIKLRLRQKDKRMFDSVFTHYYTGLCAYAYQFVKDRDVAEDLVQDFFVSFWNNAVSIEIKGSLKSYFFTSVRNRSLDYLKHRHVADNYIEEVQKSVEESRYREELSENDLIKEVEELIDKLQPRCKEIFRLSRFDGLTNKEIAKKLKISKRTVELQVSKALSHIRKEIKKPDRR